MYCSKCGRQIQNSSNYCEKCGNKVRGGNDASLNLNVGEKLRKIKSIDTMKIVKVIMALCLVCFVMPFVTVSCGNTEVAVSGVELATGNMSDEMYVDNDDIPANIFVIVTIIATIIGFIAALANKDVQVKIFAFVSIIGLIIFRLTIKLYYGFDEMDEQYFEIKSNSGYWLSIIFNIAAIFFSRENPNSLNTYDFNYKRCREPKAENLKMMFSLSYKEILCGEGIADESGKLKKRISVIKDDVIRFAAQNKGELSFAINQESGTAYKILKIRDSGEKYFYAIDYFELNKYLKMNEAAYDKYKTVTSLNWREIIK